VAEPEDEMAAGGRGRMRVSHADREQVVDLLKAAFVQERLAKDEFDLRIGQALASRTLAELTALTADIPSDIPIGPAAARPRRIPARNQKAVRTLACVTGGAVSLFALPYAVTVLTDGQPPHAQTVMFLVVVFIVFAVPLAAVLLQAWLAKHHSRPSAS
jgi:hypothetical protein